MAGDGIAPNGVYRVDVQSGRTELLVSERMVYPGQGIDLSPDGRFLYYRSWVEDEHSRRVLRKDLDSGSVEEVYVAPSGWIWNLALSPDGSSLAVSLAVMAEEGPEVFVLPAAGGPARELTPPVSKTGARSITWMPDGKAILYSSWREVSRVPAAGGEPESIGLEMELINTVSLHPDGRRIALSAGRPASELWVMEDFLPGHRTGNDDNGQN
jgi:Tol biopolymer transport system component